MTDPQFTKQQADAGPITVSVSRRVLAGKEDQYEQWIKAISAASAQFDGHQGVSILRPCHATNGEYVIIYRFDTYENAHRWEQSKERAAWVSKVPELVEGEAVHKRVTGLEFWFDLPSVPATATPVKYKMAMVTTVVVYCLVLVLATALSPLIGQWPFWVKLLLVIPIQVGLMTYLVMPLITRLLKFWLFSNQVLAV